MNDWYISLTFTTTHALTVEDIGFEINEALADYHAICAVGVHGGSVSLTVSAHDAFSAMRMVPAIITTLSHLVPDLTVTATSILSEPEFQKELDTPSIPELVGITEIAEMIGSSTQQVNTLTHREGFPSPLVTLAMGRFYGKAAIERWVAQWDRTPGRKTTSAFTAP